MQTTPHRPQFMSSDAGSTQRPPHSIQPSRQTVRLQTPPTHPRPPSQAAPHAPQCRPSVAVFTQVSPQSVCPAGH